MLQVFDLLSLYFCCDGYDGDRMQHVVLEQVPVGPNSDKVVDIEIEPVGPNAVRFKPYPFDLSPLPISVLGRKMSAHEGEPEAVAQEAYYKAPRCQLAWELSS